jgi:transposase InsO family protein
MESIQREDVFCKPILEALKNPDSASHRTRSLFYVIKDGILYRKVFRDGRNYLLLVVPKTIWPNVLQEAHDALVSGHLGVTRTYSRIKDRYYFPGALEAVARYVASCESCQRKNDPPRKPGGYLQPLSVAGPFVRVHMDYCGPFTVSARRNKYLLLAIDPHTKYVIAKAVPHATAVAAATFLVNNVILVHGAVKEILTDRGTHFTGAVMQEILRLLDVKHLLTTAYHAQCDGAAERALKTFVTIMSHYVSMDQKNWDLVVPFVAFTVNAAKSDTTNYSPFELVYGRPPLHPLDLALNFSGFEEIAESNTYAATVADWLKTAREIALEKVNGTHDITAPRFNEKRADVEFKEGDLVLEWRPITAEGLTTKLLRKWTGPLRVLKQTSPVNYEIEPLEGTRKPYVVHVERLKLYNERAEQELFQIPADDQSDFSEIENDSQPQSEKSDSESHDERNSEMEPIRARPKRNIKKPNRFIADFHVLPFDSC